VQFNTFHASIFIDFLALVAIQPASMLILRSQQRKQQTLPGSSRFWGKTAKGFHRDGQSALV
jgi:hypothetical protein